MVILFETPETLTTLNNHYLFVDLMIPKQIKSYALIVRKLTDPQVVVLCSFVELLKEVQW